jgi:hypothetical protein
MRIELKENDNAYTSFRREPTTILRNSPFIHITLFESDSCSSFEPLRKLSLNQYQMVLPQFQEAYTMTCMVHLQSSIS